MYPLAQNLNVVLRQDINSLKYTFQQLHTDKMSDINKLCHYWFWLHTSLKRQSYIYIFSTNTIFIGMRAENMHYYQARQAFTG